MNKQQIQQFFNTINNSNKILILLPASPTIDTITSGLAVCNILKTLKKNSDIISNKIEIEKKLSFLPDIHLISPTLQSSKKFVIQLNLESKKIDEFSYAIEDDKLNIFITPKEGQFEKTDVTTLQEKPKYDLIIMINIKNLENLGKIFETNSSLFFKTPILNIDNDPNNEHFGQINILDLTSSSISEIIFSLIEEKEEIITPQIATTLLSGIISETNCFKKKNVTPQTLLAVSSLMDHGANREDIIKNLYKKNTLSSIRLLGKALNKLQYDQQTKIAWTTITNKDFLETKSKPNEISYIMDELINNMGNTNIITLFYETTFNTIEVLIHTAPQINLGSFCKKYKTEQIKKQLQTTLKKISLENAVQDIIGQEKLSLQNKN